MSQHANRPIGEGSSEEGQDTVFFKKPATPVRRYPIYDIKIIKVLDIIKA